MASKTLSRITRGRTDLVCDFLADGNWATSVDGGGTALIKWCAYYGDVSAMRFLLANGESHIATLPTVNTSCILLVSMTDLVFSWDEAKSRSNATKHGVSFDEAQSAFSDEHARIIDDPDHSDDEDRFILLGMSGKPRLLIVVYAYLDREAKIRIISARKALPRERALYNQKARS